MLCDAPEHEESGASKTPPQAPNFKLTHYPPFGEATMNIKRILFATDFSECSGAALEVASRLASETGARLDIMHVNGLLDISIPSIPPTEGGYCYDAPWGYERREVRE